jgi:hypothetical protein
MAGGVFSKEWMKDLGKWATEQARKLFESKLFGGKAAAGGTAAPGAGTIDTDKRTKWLPFALIGAALLSILFLFKRKK